MRAHRKYLGDEGQAIVELALVLPIILLLMVGILEFARAWNVHQVLTDSVREGARRAVLADTIMNQDSVKAVIWRYLSQAGYDPQYDSVAITPPGNWKASGQSITVTARVPYKIWVIGNKSFTMESSFTMRNE